MRAACLLVVVAVLLGLSVRLEFSLGYWLERPLTNDEQEHLALARSIATGSGFNYPPSSTSTLPQERFSRPPVYPAFMALVGGSDVAGDNPASSPARVKIARSVVGSSGVLLIGALSWRVGGSVAGAIAAAIAAAYPPLVWICAYVLSEALYSTLALSTVLVLGTVIDDKVTTQARYRLPILDPTFIICVAVWGSETISRMRREQAHA